MGGELNMDFSEVIKNRYSCKKFSDRKVEKEKLDKILEAGRVAPTAKNLQEQHIYVVQSEKGLAAIDKVTPCRYGAPVVLVAAYNEGVDSCWINFFNPDEQAQALNLPEDEEVLMLLDLGIAVEGTKALPNHNSRKELTETVTYM